MVTTSTCIWKLGLMVAMAVIMDSACTADCAESEEDLLASVQVYNLLPDPLELHCQSDNRDLHIQWLPGMLPGHTRGFAHFGWDFYPKIWWGRTEYFCMFVWPRQRKFRYFAVWSEQYQECHHCVWQVRTDGFYKGVDKQPGRLKLTHVWDDSEPKMKYNAPTPL